MQWVKVHIFHPNVVEWKYKVAEKQKYLSKAQKPENIKGSTWVKMHSYTPPPAQEHILLLAVV